MVSACYVDSVDVDEQLLTEAGQGNRLYQHRWLVEDMNVDPLLDPLLNIGCITSDDVHRIKYRPKEEMNRVLLEILMRRSRGQYKQFKECLRMNNQLHIVDRLDCHKGN